MTPPQNRIALGLSGLLPVLVLAVTGFDTMPLIYTALVLVLLSPRASFGFGRASFWFFVAFLLSGILTEVLAWLSGYLAGKATPVTFHPQLIPDLLLGLGFYGGMAVAWIIALRWFRFSLVSALVIAGIYGVFIEQDGAVVIAIVQGLAAANPVVIMLGAYVFIIYASFTGIAFAPFMRGFDNPARSSHWLRFLLVPALLYAFTHIGVFIVFTISEAMGGLPAPRSALEFPLW